MPSINLELQPFSVPEFVTLKIPKNSNRVSLPAPPVTLGITELSEDTLLAMCEEFTTAVFAAAGKSV